MKITTPEYTPDFFKYKTFRSAYMVYVNNKYQYFDINEGKLDTD